MCQKENQYVTRVSYFVMCILDFLDFSGIACVCVHACGFWNIPHNVCLCEWIVCMQVVFKRVFVCICACHFRLDCIMCVCVRACARVTSD